MTGVVIGASITMATATALDRNPIYDWCRTNADLVSLLSAFMLVALGTRALFTLGGGFGWVIVGFDFGMAGGALWLMHLRHRLAREMAAFREAVHEHDIRVNLSEQRVWCVQHDQECVAVEWAREALAEFQRLRQSWPNN